MTFKSNSKESNTVEQEPYKIIADRDANALQRKVTIHLKQGYKVTGGVTTSVSGNLCQAVVLPDKLPEGQPK